MAQDFDLQVAEFQIRIAALNRNTALWHTRHKARGINLSGKGEARSDPDLCKRAVALVRLTLKRGGITTRRAKTTGSACESLAHAIAGAYHSQ